jgi:hypothetical protein
MRACNRTPLSLSSKLSISLTKFSFCQALVPLHEPVPSVLSNVGLEFLQKWHFQTFKAVYINNSVHCYITFYLLYKSTNMYKMGSCLLSTCTLYSGDGGGVGDGPTEGIVEQCHFFVSACGMYLCYGEEGSSNGFGVLCAFTAPQHKISSSSVSHQTLTEYWQSISTRKT